MYIIQDLHARMQASLYRGHIDRFNYGYNRPTGVLTYIVYMSVY